MEKKDYRPEEDDKPQFINKVKGVNTFSENKFFKTVFVTGDDMVAEEEAIKQRELEEWNAKIVVASKHFGVNTKPMCSSQAEKYKGLREDPVKKIGLRIAPKRLAHLNER